jgi:CheY-like chemotaxis protein
MVSRAILKSGVFGPEGVEIFEAANGLEGLELFGAQHPQLVLADSNMPVMSGIEMARKIREAGGQIPILMMMPEKTQEKTTELTAQGLANDVLAKPVNPAELKEKISKFTAG